MLVTFVVKIGEKIRKSSDFKENPRKITPKKVEVQTDSLHYFAAISVGDFTK